MCFSAAALCRTRHRFLPAGATLERVARMSDKGFPAVRKDLAVGVVLISEDERYGGDGYHFDPSLETHICALAPYRYGNGSTMTMFTQK